MSRWTPARRRCSIGASVCTIAKGILSMNVSWNVILICGMWSEAQIALIMNRMRSYPAIDHVITPVASHLRQPRVAFPAPQLLEEEVTMITSTTAVITSAEDHTRDWEQHLQQQHLVIIPVPQLQAVPIWVISFGDVAPHPFPVMDCLQPAKSRALSHKLI